MNRSARNRNGRRDATRTRTDRAHREPRGRVSIGVEYEYDVLALVALHLGGGVELDEQSGSVVGDEQFGEVDPRTPGVAGDVAPEKRARGPIRKDAIDLDREALRLRRRRD